MKFKKNSIKHLNKPCANVSWTKSRPTNISPDFMRIAEQQIARMDKLREKQGFHISSLKLEGLLASNSVAFNDSITIDESNELSGIVKSALNSKHPSPLIHPASTASISYSQNGTPKSSMQIIEDHLLSKVFIKRLYGGIYLYNGKYYLPLTEQDYTILLRRESDDGIISILKSYRAMADGYRFLASNPDIEFPDYNVNSIRFKTCIAFDNVLMDAKSSEIFNHHPDYPVFFGVNACYKKHPDDTPYWDAFLDSTSQGDKKIKRLICEMLGYLLLQGNDGKCFFVLATAPNSGKSLLGDFIESLFPSAFVSHIAIDNFSDRFSLGSLWKTTVNVSMDLPQSVLGTGTVSLIKTITGDSKITAEEKYMPKCTALNRCKLVFGTNSQIAISTPDKAFWDRVIIVPFLHEVPRANRIPDLLAHFIEEKDDILSKCIPYVTKLIQRNYEFTLPDIAARMKEAWSGNARDSIGDFFGEHCQIVQFPNEASTIPVQELFDLYQSHCQREQMVSTITDLKTFSKVIASRYPDIEKGKKRMSGYSNPISVFTNINYHE